MPGLMLELLRYRALLRNLVLKDLKLKYRGSLLGLFWSLLNPLATLAVYTFAFRAVFRVPMEDYPLFLMVGLLPWTFLSGALLASTAAIPQAAHLLRTIHFPREVLPLASVLFAFVQLLLALGVFLPCSLALSRRPWQGATLLALPALLLLHLVFAAGLALALSALTVFFRDVSHLTEVGLMLLFWLTPIVYPVSMAPARIQPLLKASPFSAFAIGYQDLLFWGRLPDPLVLVVIVLAPAGTLLLGLTVFRRLSAGFAERV